jgi:hypothetical protein
LRDLQRAKDEFSQYMHEVISSASASTNISARGDLVSSMVKAGKQDTSSALSENEVVGNVFVFVLAGHETTATTLQTALILLAANPELQQEIQNEIRDIWTAKTEGEDLNYLDYPKMRTIMALMVRTPSPPLRSKAYNPSLKPSASTHPWCQHPNVYAPTKLSPTATAPFSFQPAPPLPLTLSPYNATHSTGAHPPNNSSPPVG